MYIMKMEIYKDGSFEKWFNKLDARAGARVLKSIKKAANGNMNECKPVGGGAYEVRNHDGPGYRVYYGTDQGNMVLLGGSVKKDQQRAINAAVGHWKNYKAHSPETRKTLCKPFRM